MLSAYLALTMMYTPFMIMFNKNFLVEALDTLDMLKAVNEVYSFLLLPSLKRIIKVGVNTRGQISIMLLELLVSK